MAGRAGRRGKYGDELKSALDTASSQTRNLFIAFLFFLLYVFVMVAGTTHMDLLNPESRIKMPVLGIGLPTLYFYFIAPFLLLVFHFNLLFNLYQHARKLAEWKKLHSQNELLYPFMFNYLAVDAKRDVYYWMVNFVTWVTVYLSPLCLLVFVQLKFLPYHSNLITSWHIVAVVLDEFLLLFFWKKIRKSDRKLNLFFFKPRVLSLINGLILIPLFFFPFFMAVIPKTDNDLNYMISKLIIDRNIYLPEATLVGTPPSDEIIAAYIAKSRTEEERKKAKSQAFINFGRGLELRGRDLRFAFFGNANLQKADLRFAELQSANLRWANLQGAYLSGAELQGANLIWANLQGADLEEANLNSADLTGAELQGANLSGASLQGADLNGANLQGANLKNAKLQGANLIWANLQGANLKNAKLQGADLQRAKLQGADLFSAKLQGAYFERAKIEGALAYEIVSEDKDKIDWVEITEDIKEWAHAWILEDYQERISFAKERYENPPDLPFKEPVDKDVELFIQKRTELVCKDDYIDAGILKQINSYQKLLNESSINYRAYIYGLISALEKHNSVIGEALENCPKKQP